MFPIFKFFYAFISLSFPCKERYTLVSHLLSFKTGGLSPLIYKSDAEYKKIHKVFVSRKKMVKITSYCTADVLAPALPDPLPNRRLPTQLYFLLTGLVVCKLALLSI